MQQVQKPQSLLLLLLVFVTASTATGKVIVDLKDSFLGTNGDKAVDLTSTRFEGNVIFLVQAPGPLFTCRLEIMLRDSYAYRSGYTDSATVLLDGLTTCSGVTSYLSTSQTSIRVFIVHVDTSIRYFDLQRVSLGPGASLQVEAASIAEISRGPDASGPISSMQGVSMDSQTPVLYWADAVGIWSWAEGQAAALVPRRQGTQPTTISAIAFGLEAAPRFSYRVEGTEQRTLAMSSTSALSSEKTATLASASAFHDLTPSYAASDQGDDQVVSWGTSRLTVFAVLADEVQEIYINAEEPALTKTVASTSVPGYDMRRIQAWAPRGYWSDRRRGQEVRVFDLWSLSADGTTAIRTWSEDYSGNAGAWWINSILIATVAVAGVGGSLAYYRSRKKAMESKRLQRRQERRRQRKSSGAASRRTSTLASVGSKSARSDAVPRRASRHSLTGGDEA